MQSLRLSTRLISGSRMLPRLLLYRCSHQHQYRTFRQSTLRWAETPTDQREPQSTAEPKTYSINRGWRIGEGDAVVDDTQERVPFRYLASQPKRKRQAKNNDMNVEYVKIENPNTSWHPAYLRDACSCPKCVDPSSTQKTFQTTDIPPSLKAKSVEVQEDGQVEITWENDIPGFEDHVSSYPSSFFYHHLTQREMSNSRYEQQHYKIWNKAAITKDLGTIKYDDYMKDDQSLHLALKYLMDHGLLFLKGVPQSETAVEDITSRLGSIRDTFYGRTWDVKSVPEAKNVAYTHQYLGLHMDLLYMANPPGFQLLHCLKNTCEGGTSLFSDTFQAAAELPARDYGQLRNSKLAYHYKNAGEHYYFEHPVLEGTTTFVATPIGTKQLLTSVNYSPPFQANHTTTAMFQHYPFPEILRALKSFAARVESPDNLFEYKMEEGDCVIFNNRRVLHGRREFDAKEGERWLKGTYVDTDVVLSRWRVLEERFKPRTLEEVKWKLANQELRERVLKESKATKPKQQMPPDDPRWKSPFKRKEKSRRRRSPVAPVSELPPPDTTGSEKESA